MEMGKHEEASFCTAYYAPTEDALAASILPDPYLKSDTNKVVK